MVSIVAYDKACKMTVSIRGERYSYFDVSLHWKEKFQWWIDQGWFGLVFGKLEMFSRPELFREVKDATNQS